VINKGGALQALTGYGIRSQGEGFFVDMKSINWREMKSINQKSLVYLRGRV